MTRVSTVKAVTLGFSALAILCLGAFPAFAQAPPVVPEPVLSEVEEVVVDPLDKVKEVVQDTVVVVEDTATQTTETVEDAVADVTSTVDELVHQPNTGTDPEAPTDPVTTDPGGPNPVDENHNQAERPVDRVHSGFVKNERNDASSAQTDRSASRPNLPRASGVESAPQEIAAGRFPAPTGPLTPGEAAQRLAFPIAMTAAVVLFLLLQGRFDRRDPKLMKTMDLSGDGLSFE